MGKYFTWILHSIGLQFVNIKLTFGVEPTASLILPIAKVCKSDFKYQGPFQRTTLQIGILHSLSLLWAFDFKNRAKELEIKLLSLTLESRKHLRLKQGVEMSKKTIMSRSVINLQSTIIIIEELEFFKWARLVCTNTSFALFVFYLHKYEVRGDLV